MNNVNFLAERGKFLSEVANFGQVGIQWKGYSINSQNGSVTYRISQPGNMRQIAGIAAYSVDVGGGLITDQRIDFNIDSSKVIDSVPLLSICPQGPTGHVNNALPFFPVYRSIQGNSDIELVITSTQVLNITLVIYFMP
jgi:hypothetical protein